ncbi:beta-phosphoglucomutase family hydrolase [soil metagenome]
MSFLTTAILDVDGVLLASPHERAWREALTGFCDPVRFTPEMYRTEVAGKPRLDGARAALIALGAPDAEARAGSYAVRKQARLEALIRAGRIKAFPDAVRFVQALRLRTIRMAAASSSRNATAMMRSIRLENGDTLLDVFDADVSGRALAHGKPAPDIFLLAATALRTRPADCFVVEDSPAGIEAAKAAGMRALGVARADETALLVAAGADLVVATLDAVDLTALVAGRLRGKAA